VKITIQTTSTKCQYRPVISTVMALALPSFPCNARTHSVSSHKTPTVTCAPCVPVGTKSVRANRFVCSVRPLCTNSVNSITWPPRNTSPSSAVQNSQIFPHFMSPRCTAASASTIIRLDISRSNVLTDVNGMLRISCGSRGSSYLERLKRPEVNTSEQHGGPHEREPQRVGERRERENRQAEGREHRPPRSARHMDRPRRRGGGVAHRLVVLRLPARQPVRHRGDHGEVVDRRRRGDAPLQ